MIKKYNLTRYHIGDRVILGKDENGYPFLEAEILAKLPKMAKVRLEDNSYFNKPNERWLSADDWWVIARRKEETNG